LHDELGQMLTALKMDLSSLKSRIPPSASGAATKASAMAKLIDDTLDAVRGIAADLRPVMLDDLGLRAAVEWLLEDFSKRSGIKYELETELNNFRLDDDRTTAAFRIVQECLTNVVRHAQASHVAVNIGYRNDELRVSVKDDGKGIAPIVDRQPKSFGLLGIRERAAHFGGSMTISGAEGSGTVVEVRLPQAQNRRGMQQ
jgi:two-component system, NarL family, sensor histidine kinase UhpB